MSNTKKFDYIVGEILTPKFDVYYSGTNLLKGEKYEVIKIFEKEKNFLLKNLKDDSIFKAHHYWLDRMGLDFYTKKLKKLILDNNEWNIYTNN